MYTLTLSETSGKYEATITAPDKSSYNNNAGHYYPVSITATDQAGNSVTIDDTDSTLGNSLKLKVKEKVKPVISKLVPSNGAYLSTSAPEITATLTDDDSGIAISTLVLKIDGQTINNTNITKTTTTGGYNISYTPTTNQQVVTPDFGYDYLSQVTVEKIPYKEELNSAGGSTAPFKATYVTGWEDS